MIRKRVSNGSRLFIVDLNRECHIVCCIETSKQCVGLPVDNSIVILGVLLGVLLGLLTLRPLSGSYHAISVFVGLIILFNCIFIPLVGELVHLYLVVAIGVEFAH